MKRHPITKGIQKIELESWKEFYELIATDFADSPAYVYRGQADAAWPTFSSLDRWEQQHPTKPNRAGKNRPEFLCHPVTRDVHLRRFRQAVRSIAPFDLPKEEEGPAWALAQHHGLRTPLLDWSLSPFVALYFAFEDELIARDRELLEPEHRAVLALSTSVIPKEDHGAQSKSGYVPRVYSPSGPVSRRLLAQSSIFLEMPAKVDLETFISEHFADETERPGSRPRAVLKKIVIRNLDRLDCLQMLNRMNINRMTLFPDLDGAARYINDLWDLDPDNTLGYFEDTDYAASSRTHQPNPRRPKKNTKARRPRSE
jgi:hypothetical protein